MIIRRLWFAKSVSVGRLAVTAFLLCVPLAAQVSPGPLARAHQQLEGVSKCASCHDFGAPSRSFKCLNCHLEIRRRVESQAGFHARAYKPTVGQLDCVRCHMEHNGEGFPLIRFDTKNFDHQSQTGYVLEGKHRELKCDSCHSAKRIPAAERAEIKIKDLNHSFLGLRRECTFCHEDRHRGQLGQQCASCHSQTAWKPAQGFNHGRTHFPLTGLHQSVACEKCHAKPGADNLQFAGLSFSGCQSCHSDPHRGAFADAKFRGSCDSCHNTSGWKNNHPNGKFDHAGTRFPLTGKHAGLACAECHKTSDFHRPIPHDRCQDCHQDVHNGQFAARAGGSDCAACHVDSGFRPAKFDADAHRNTAFPLDGKHATLACSKCHQPEGRSTVYKTGKTTCKDCHQDQHAGQFLAEFGNRCELCHTMTGFLPATFTPGRHAQTRFPLAGKHNAIECGDCHKPAPATASALAAPVAPPRRYRFDSLACAACHADPHPTTLACESCHASPESWTALHPYNHDAAGFQPDGAHLKAKCIDCHKPQAPALAAAAKPIPSFAKIRVECSACHMQKDPHGGQFQQGDRFEDCSACHTRERWDPPAFSHEKTRFPLDVAHRNVACAKCHAPPKEAAKPIPRYRGTPVACVQCH